MYPLITLNLLVLLALLLLLIREEVRFRRFDKTVKATKEDLTTIVHQLRSPLGNLRKYSEFLQSNEFGRLSLSQQEALGNVQSSLGELLLLLDRLMARSRLDVEKVAMQTTSLNLREVILGVVESIMPIAKQKNHILTVDGKKKILLVTDPILLHGILDELLSNAVHYTPDGGEISVSLTEKNSLVSITVRDTGIGISPEERSRVFEKYFRGKRARKMFQSNGLGLAFAKQFATTLGGTIQCHSKEGKGSIFTVSLFRKAD